jgi:hypothetical protein
MNVMDLLGATAKDVEQTTAYADNFVVADTLPNLQAAYKTIKERGKPYGCIFESRASNCIYVAPGTKLTWSRERIQAAFPGFTVNTPQPWVRGGFIPEAIEEEIEMAPRMVAHGLPRMELGSEDSVGMRDVGIPKGTTPFKIHYVESKMKRVVWDARAATRTLHPRTAYKILKRCLIPRLTFLTGVVPMAGDDEWTALVQRFDKLVLEQLTMIQGSVMDEVTAGMSRLPVKSGGRGIESLEMTASASFLAKQMQVFRNVQTAILVSKRDCRPQGWDECVEDYNSRVAPEHQLKGTYWELSLAHIKKEKLRKHLLAPVYEKARSEWKELMTDERKIQLEVQSLAGANLWLESGPMSDELGVAPFRDRGDYMPPRVWRALFQRHALGAKKYDLPFGQEREEQQCGRVAKNCTICKDTIFNDLDHATDMCRSMRNEKHQAGAGAIVALAQRAGLSATMKGTIAGTTLRGDVTIHGLHVRPIVLDFANVTPLNTKIYKRDSKDDEGKKWKAGEFDVLRHLREVQDRKKKKYATLCEGVGLEFFPFVTSTYGAWGNDTRTVVQQLAIRLSERYYVSYAKARWSRRGFRARC